MRKVVFLLMVLAMGLGACTVAPRGATATSPRPHVAPTYPDPYGKDAVEDPEIPVFKMSTADTPKWEAVRSQVGGLPVPRGWKLVEREDEGYSMYEEYRAPVGVTYDQVLAWYLRWFPDGKPWGGWTYCSGIAGSGDAQMYADIPENWAWRNPSNDHLIQIGLGGAPSGDAEGTLVMLSRSEFGEDCIE